MFFQLSCGFLAYSSFAAIPVLLDLVKMLALWKANRALNPRRTLLQMTKRRCKPSLLQLRELTSRWIYSSDSELEPPPLTLTSGGETTPKPSTQVKKSVGKQVIKKSDTKAPLYICLWVFLAKRSNDHPRFFDSDIDNNNGSDSDAMHSEHSPLMKTPTKASTQAKEDAKDASVLVYLDSHPPILDSGTWSADQSDLIR